MTHDADIGRRIDAVHQHLQLQLAERCATDDPLIVICALGLEIIRRVELLESAWTPKALDRFLVDFTRLLRRHILDRHQL